MVVKRPDEPVLRSQETAPDRGAMFTAALRAVSVEHKGSWSTRFRWADERPPAQRSGVQPPICDLMAFAVSVMVCVGSAPPTIAATALPHGPNTAAMAVIDGMI